MEKHFRNVSKFYKGYFDYKDKLTKEYNEAQESGNYSRQYLKKMSDRHSEQLKNERSVIANKMTKIKEEFLNDLSYKYDFEKSFVVDNRLQKLLKSGIKLNERELLEIAERHKSNLTDSRILHDYAKEQGYKLSNYIPYEDVVLNFENYCRHISNSLSATDSLAMPYLTSEECEMAGGHLYKLSTVPKMEIEPIEQTLEEIISKDVKKQNEISELQREAFLLGLKGTEEERENFIKNININAKTDKEILKDKIDLLTAQEKADAKYLSIYKGHEGEITEEEIEFIESKEYTEIVEEREKENKSKQ